MAYSTPPTFTAGNTLTAAELNAYLRDNFKALGDAWTSYTPTTTNITLGNGTLSAAYVSVGKMTFFRIKFTLGSTSAITGAPTFTLPATATATRTINAQLLMYDTSANTFKGGWAFNNTTTTVVLRDDASAVLSSTAPFTWATGDEIVITGTYEAA
ncbi:hypothetical protein [Nocardioides stalactiti]|uniref:hypothetical protein n=1 Tax=Nocardioides stalactiti TaxID=2755356 RepID=UPI00160326C2|nr:hypothetical protein [Nocardioides stalactiti]